MSMPSDGRVVVLAGGLSAERDVSIRSGRRVADALRGTGADVAVLDVDSSLMSSLAADRPACVVPLLHGAAGEDGAVRDVLVSLGLPFVGSGPSACRQAFDKPIASALVGPAGVAVPGAMALPHTTFRELGASAVLDAVVARLGLPLDGEARARGLVARCHRHAHGGRAACGDGGCLRLLRHRADRVVRAAGPRSPCRCSRTRRARTRCRPSRSSPDGGFYDYDARYTAGATEYFTPARLSDECSPRVAETAVRVHRTLGLRDWSRTRPHRRRVGHAVVPRGQRRTRHDRDVDLPSGRRGGRPGPRSDHGRPRLARCHARLRLLLRASVTRRRGFA